MVAAGGSAPHALALLVSFAENGEAILWLEDGSHLREMTPIGSATAARNSKLDMRLLVWAVHQGVLNGVWQHDCFSSPGWFRFQS